MSNLQIWDAVQETDRTATKTSHFDGRDITSINGTYMVKRATEVFGPIGIGWGYEIVEERLDEGADITKDQVVVGKETVHTIKLRFWYMQDGKRGEFEHYGHTPFIMRSKWGAYQDNEAPKKSLTDALKKCLSMLGFSADIFLGMYDDQAYVESIEVKQSIEKADKQDEAYTEERTKFLEWLDKETAAYTLVPNAAALKMVYNGHVKKAQRQCGVLNMPFDKVQAKLKAAYDARIAEILPTVVCTSCGEESRDKPGNVCRSCGGKKAAPESAETKE